jgi:hypothetical protein
MRIAVWVSKAMVIVVGVVVAEEERKSQACCRPHLGRKLSTVIDTVVMMCRKTTIRMVPCCVVSFVAVDMVNHIDLAVCIVEAL